MQRSYIKNLSTAVVKLVDGRRKALPPPSVSFVMVVGRGIGHNLWVTNKLLIR